MPHTKKLAAGLSAVAVLGFVVPFASGGSNGTHGSKAKNVILFIGDGMGDSEVTSARYYQYGAAGRLNVDKLPITGFQTTWSVKPDGKPDYDPDSASTGTMWATGEKTIDERISQGPGSGEKVPGKNVVTILEKAQRPARGPATCRPRRSPTRPPPCSTRTSRCVVARARRTRRRPARPRRRPPAASARSRSRPEWTGPAATLGEGTPAQRCVTTNRPTDQPSLTAMTKKAIDLLEGDRDGFFLQVEGASIDKQDHAANACGQIGEVIAFDNAIAVAQAYARKHPDTLILVTADHAHTSQIVAEDSSGTGNPTGYSNNLITADDQVLRVTYGTAGGTTPPAVPPSQQHTGSVVPIWGQGPGSAAVGGTTDHTDLFDLITGGHGRR